MKIMGSIRKLMLNRKRLVFWTLVIIVGIAVMAPLSLLVLNSFRQVDVGELDFGLNKFTLRNLSLHSRSYLRRRRSKMISLHSFMQLKKS